MHPFSLPLPPLSGRPAPLEALVQGQQVENDRGTFFRRRLDLDVDDRYGECRLGDFLSVRRDAAAALARVPDLRDVPLESVLFLDTETTGLAGGTGTLAFMVGLGYFSNTNGDARFVVEQCMMRSHAEERAMLSWLADLLQRFAAIVTFNGRSFDVPLLQTRFLMSRMRVDFEAWLQFDLLHASRRLWRLALTSCSLQHIERHVLRAGREDDIESILIPSIYFQYLRDGDGRYLQRVFNHNRADVLAMVGIATRACAMLGAHDSDSTGPELTAPEQLALARVFEQMDSPESAERAYRAALAGRLPVDLRCRALMGLAALLKRRRRAEEAAEFWQAVVDESPLYSVPALVELSKYWEHQRKDPARAFELARRARDRWLGGRPAGARSLPGLSDGGWTNRPPSAPDDFVRRLDRLERKRTLLER